jgi:competence ComEA-like helix-hairpin-helix protein
MKTIPDNIKTQIKRIALGLFFIGLLSQVLTAPKPADDEENTVEFKYASGIAPTFKSEADNLDEEVNGLRLINLNTSSEKELCSLPGVGKKLARRIMDFRSEHKFHRKEDLMFVKGIGSLKFEKVKNLIIVQ